MQDTLCYDVAQPRRSNLLFCSMAGYARPCASSTAFTYPFRTKRPPALRDEDTVAKRA